METEINLGGGRDGDGVEVGSSCISIPTYIPPYPMPLSLSATPGYIPGRQDTPGTIVATTGCTSGKTQMEVEMGSSYLYLHLYLRTSLPYASIPIPPMCLSPPPSLSRSISISTSTLISISNLTRISKTTPGDRDRGECEDIDRSTGRVGAR